MKSKNEEGDDDNYWKWWWNERTSQLFKLLHCG